MLLCYPWISPLKQRKGGIFLRPCFMAQCVVKRDISDISMAFPSNTSACLDFGCEWWRWVTQWMVATKYVHAQHEVFTPFKARMMYHPNIKNYDSDWYFTHDSFLFFAVCALMRKIIISLAWRHIFSFYHNPHHLSIIGLILDMLPFHF